ATQCPPGANQNIGLLAFQNIDPYSPPNFNPKKCAPQIGTCDFVNPVKRLLVNPDGLELVFFDRFDEWDNAALAAFFALIALKKSSSLCNYVRPSLAQTFMKRPYTLFRLNPFDC